MMYPQIRRGEPRICSAAWCRKSNKQSTLFYFPTDDSRAKQWDTALIYRTCFSTEERALCSDHFEDKCFTSPLKTNLLPNAIPTRQVKVKEEQISNDEISKSPFSESETHAIKGTENASFPAISRVALIKESLKRKNDIEKTLDEYLQKRHLVNKKLKQLEEELLSNRNPPKKPVLLKDHRTKVGGDVRNVVPKKRISKAIKTKKQKTKDFEEIKLSEHDLNLMSCCLMNSIDKMAELENDVIDESNLKAFLIQAPKQSENQVKKLESNTLKSGAENNLSKTSTKRTENNVIVIVKTGTSSNASSLIKSGAINKSAKEGVKNPSKILSIRTEDNVKGIDNSSILSIRTEGNVKCIDNSSKILSIRTEDNVKGIEISSKLPTVKTENDVFMTTKEIEYLSEISIATDSSIFRTAKDKVENSSKLLNISPEIDGHQIVNEGVKNHRSETSKLSEIESKDVHSSEASDGDICDKFENGMSDKSNSSQSSLELQSGHNVHIEEHLSKEVENSPNVAIKWVEENSLTPLRTENSVIRTAEESVENPVFQESDSSKNESNDICILEISEDYSSFGVNVAERLKKLKDPFVRIKALLGIQQVLLEAECSMADKK